MPFPTHHLGYRVLDTNLLPFMHRSTTLINPFLPNDCLLHCETFSFIMSLLAMSLGLKFCMNRKGRTGGGGWVHPKGANSMAMSGLACRKALVGTRT